MSATVAKPAGAAISRTPHPRPRSRLPSGTGRLTEVASLVGGLILWELLGRALALPWLPPFSACIAALVSMLQEGLILPDLFDSLVALAGGFLASLTVSLVLGFLMAEFELVDLAVGPYVYAFFLLPSIAVAPVFLAIFGIDPITVMAVVFVYCFFYMTLNFHTAFSLRDAALVEMAESFQASRIQRARWLIVPAALPLVMATIRIGLSRAVKGMINGQQFIAIFGLGGLIQRYGTQFAADKVFAVILVIVGLALVLDVAMRLLDARWTRWAAR